MTKKTDIIFKEVQKFRQLWLWLIVILVFLLLVGTFGYGMVQQLVFGIPWGNNPMSNITLLIVGGFSIAIGVGILLLFCAVKIETEIRSDGLYIRFFPFHLSFRKIHLDELKRYEVRTYSPIKEYGGWGIRYGLKGKAYNVSGNRGVQLELLNGERILIGSQKPEELVKAINLAIGINQNKY